MIFCKVDYACQEMSWGRVGAGSRSLEMFDLTCRVNEKARRTHDLPAGINIGIWYGY